VRQNTTETQFKAMPETRVVLDYVVREGARKMLQAALEVEIQEHLERFKHLVDPDANGMLSATATSRREHYSQARGRSRSNDHG
jgi:rubrerythrin